MFWIGSVLYPSLELLTRKYTDISMCFAGGLSMYAIQKVCNEILNRKPVIIKCIVGGSLITSIEFVIGVWVNMFLKHNVWDYSNMPYNILGQICPRYYLLWIILSFPAMLIGKIICTENKDNLKNSCKNNQNNV